MKKLIKTKTHFIAKHIRYRIKSTLLFSVIICFQSFSQLIIDDVTKPIYDDIYSIRAIEISVPVVANKYGEDIEVASQVSITLNTGFSASKDNGNFHAYKSTATNWVSYDGCPTTPTNVPLTAGNVYIITNGTYSGCKYIFTGTGSSSSPINIRPESPGGVEFTKNGSEPTLIEVTGSSIIMEGFKWDANDYSSYAAMIKFDNANNCAFKNNSFVSSGKTTGTSPLIRVEGNSDDLTIKRNYFEDNQNMGIQILLNNVENPSENTLIAENYFYNNITAKELIAIGQGTDGPPDYNWLFDQSTNTIIENNLFENNNTTSQVTGSVNVELLVNKSTDNVIQNNTFRNCQGAVSLRWGKNCLVNRNWFFNSDGIRIFDENHSITNNYFLLPANGDDRINQVIAVYKGELNRSDGVIKDPLFDQGHFPAKNINIYNNTIYNAVYNEGANLGTGIYIGLNALSVYIPDGIRVINNLITNNLGYSVANAAGINVTLSDNVAYPVSPGTIGYSIGSFIPTENPFVDNADDNDVYRLATTSAAINAGISLKVINSITYYILNTIGNDIDQQVRPENFIVDVGCDENYGGTSDENKPLKNDKIGPSWFQPTWVSPAPSVVKNNNKEIQEDKPIDDIFSDIDSYRILYFNNELALKIVYEGIYNVDIYNTLGQKVHSYKLDNISKETSKIENMNLENGIYVVNLVKGNTVVKSQKIAVF